MTGSCPERRPAAREEVPAPVDAAPDPAAPRTHPEPPHGHGPFGDRARRGAPAPAGRPRWTTVSVPSRFSGTERSSDGRAAATSVADGPVAAATNGTRATAAVMRSGCRRGEAFEGCERAAGEPARARPPHRITASPPQSGTGERSAPGKRGEPQVRDQAATCPGPEVGGNRRGGARPRGRNATPRCGDRGPTDDARERVVPEWTTTGSRVERWTPVRRSAGGTEEGHTKDESQERKEASGPARDPRDSRSASGASRAR